MILCITYNTYLFNINHSFSPNNIFEINTVNMGAELLIVSVKLTAT